MGGRAKAEEIVQEAFTRLWLKAPDWQPDGARVSTWLHRVVDNLCIDRKRRPRGEDLDAAIEAADTLDIGVGVSGFAPLHAPVDRDDIAAAVAGLIEEDML